MSVPSGMGETLLIAGPIFAIIALGHIGVISAATGVGAPVVMAGTVDMSAMPVSAVALFVSFCSINITLWLLGTFVALRSGAPPKARYIRAIFIRVSPVWELFLIYTRVERGFNTTNKPVFRVLVHSGFNYLTICGILRR